MNDSALVSKLHPAGEHRDQRAPLRVTSRCRRSQVHARARVSRLRTDVVAPGSRRSRCRAQMESLPAVTGSSSRSRVLARPSTSPIRPTLTRRARLRRSRAIGPREAADAATERHRRRGALEGRTPTRTSAGFRTIVPRRRRPRARSRPWPMRTRARRPRLARGIDFRQPQGRIAVAERAEHPLELGDLGSGLPTCPEISSDMSLSTPSELSGASSRGAG